MTAHAPERNPATMPPRHYTELQLDALQELASIGSGTAATALAQLLGRPVDITVPRARALGLADAVDAAGAPEEQVASALMGVGGDLEAVVLLLFPSADEATICGLLGVEADTDVGDSALGEIANILGASALGALAKMTELALEPRPPAVIHDMLGAIVASVLAETAGDVDVALMLDAELSIAGAPCSVSFMLLPTAGAVDELLARLGLDR
jgi:chemotaxis protein CheC